MIISCRRAVELTSRALDAGLGLGERFVLGLHRLGCPACRRFRTQAAEIHRLLARSGREELPPDGPRLPEELKQRIAEVLRTAGPGGPDAD